MIHSEGGRGLARSVSLADAKARFAAVVREAEGGSPVIITRHGKPVAAVVRAVDLERLERLRAAGPEGGLASLAGGWEGSDELVDRVQGSIRSGARSQADPD